MPVTALFHTGELQHLWWYSAITDSSKKDEPRDSQPSWLTVPLFIRLNTPKPGLGLLIPVPSVRMHRDGQMRNLQSLCSCVLSQDESVQDTDQIQLLKNKLKQRVSQREGLQPEFIKGLYMLSLVISLYSPWLALLVMVREKLTSLFSRKEEHLFYS